MFIPGDVSVYRDYSDKDITIEHITRGTMNISLLEQPLLSSVNNILQHTHTRTV